MKFLSDNTENLLTDDLGFGDDFLDLTPKAQPTEEIIDNLDLVKIKNLFFKRLYQENEDKSQTGRKYLQKTYQTKNYYQKYTKNF